MQSLSAPILKQCPVCKADFETKTPDKQYCSVTCRNRAHRKKEREGKVKPVPLNQAQAEALMYFTPPIDNPTQDVITQLANLLVTTKSLKPVLFRGNTMPQMEMPLRVRFGQTGIPTEWLMFYE